MTARIYRPAPNAMQSGRGKSKEWVLVHEPASPREIEPLMGYTSTSDTRAQVRLSFDTLEEAEAYAQKQRHRLPSCSPSIAPRRSGRATRTISVPIARRPGPTDGFGAMRSRLRGFALATCLILGASLPAAAEPAMWRVSDDDSHVWLFGSIHLFSRQMNWRTQTFDAALQDSEQVWFEMVFDAAAYATIARLTILDGSLRDGQRLSELLTEDQNERLDRAIAAAGLDPLVFDRLQPWMAEVTLSSGGIQGTTAGVDILIDAEVSPDKKRGFETAEEQLGFFSRVPLDQQIEGLMATIDALQAGGGRAAARPHDRCLGERRHRGAGCPDPAGNGTRRRCALSPAADRPQCSLGCDHRGRSRRGRRLDGDRRGRPPCRPRRASRAAGAARVHCRTDRPGSGQPGRAGRRLPDT
jgi:hypothetical protein